MQWLIEMIAGFVALLVSAALSQFGLDMNAPRDSDREVHRVRDCDQGSAFIAAAKPDDNC
jgi:hypothetical protein